ncbi:hypothetical protein IMSAGC014_01986 [Bacteroidaceae bacterium]|nr:hypothetical protein IMSAGC014_01986 [Bacteroidaceae bacterium]
MRALALVLNLAVENDFVLLVRVVVDNDCAVNPHGKFVEELAVLLVHFRIVEMDKVFRFIFTKHISLLVDKHFGENENYVANFVVRIVIIPNVADRHFLLNILQGEKPVKHVFNVGYVILVFFNQ